MPEGTILLRGYQQFVLVIYCHIDKTLLFVCNLFIYLFLAVLGLRCCTQAFSSCGKQELLFIVVHRLLTAVASLVAEHGL